MVTKPSVPEANTQGASGMAQLNARAALSRADVEGAELRSLADVVTAVRCAVTTAITIASRRMVAASPNDTRTPGGPAEAITPAAKGPTAKPAINTAPAVAAPAGPFRSEAHAVQALIARPTPAPRMKRPASNASECCESSITSVPAKAIVEPDHATAWRPS